MKRMKIYHGASIVTNDFVIPGYNGKRWSRQYEERLTIDDRVIRQSDMMPFIIDTISINLRTGLVILEISPEFLH